MKPFEGRALVFAYFVVLGFCATVWILVLMLL